MTNGKPGNVLLLRENSPWLRYLFWLGAMGMLLLLVQFLQAAPVEWGKAVATAAGIVLLGFSGFVLQTRKVFADTASHELVIEVRGFKHSETRRFAFDDIRGIQTVLTPDTYESSSGRTVPTDAWALYIQTGDASIRINQNLFASRSQAAELAQKIKQYCAVEISDDIDAAIAALAKDGKTIDAISLARREKDLSLTEAKELVDRLARKS